MSVFLMVKKPLISPQSVKVNEVVKLKHLKYVIN